MRTVFAAAAVLAVAGGITAGALLDRHPRTVAHVPPTAPAFPTPPGWHPLPTAPPVGTSTFCINGTECFRVDGNGYPYGVPSYDGSASPGVRGVY